MFDDPERYEYDGFYEEDTDYEDEYETDDSDYIVDDEEDENALWDDEEEAADDLPEKKRRKRKNQVVLADSDTDRKKPNYPNKPCGRSQKKNSSSKNWKPTSRNIPLRMVLTRKNRSVRSSNENCGQKPLHDWRIPPEHSGSLKM